MIKLRIETCQARFIAPYHAWVEFPRANDRRAFLQVKGVEYNHPMSLVTIHPPPDSGAYPIKRAYWDMIPFQNIFPLRESTSSASNEPACSPTGTD